LLFLLGLLGELGLGNEALTKTVDSSRLPKSLGERVVGELVDGLLGANDFAGETEILVGREEGDALKTSEDDCKDMSESAKMSSWSSSQGVTLDDVAASGD
jgi:hypothetical protein